MLIAVNGRKSGKPYTTQVNYIRQGICFIPSAHEIVHGGEICAAAHWKVTLKKKRYPGLWYRWILDKPRLVQLLIVTVTW
jgi:hypothetical protein